jgi:hypothetical protein
LLKPLLILSLTLPLLALEFTYGKGSFDTQFGLKGVMEYDVSMDVDVYSLREPHFGITKDIFLYANLDIYRSKTLDDYASYLDKASDFSPFGISAGDVASSMGAPVPVSFEMSGIDFSIGLGYELLKDKNSYLALGLGTGVSMPYIETENMVDNAELFLKILDTTKTDIMTYKLIPSVQGRYEITKGLYLEALLSYGYQFGNITNSYIQGEGDFSGTVLHSDIGISYMPIDDGSFLSRLVLDMGYRYNDWDTEKMSVEVMDFGHDFSKDFDLGFSSKFFYFGAGLRF